MTRCQVSADYTLYQVAHITHSNSSLYGEISYKLTFKANGRECRGVGVGIDQGKIYRFMETCCLHNWRIRLGKGLSHPSFDQDVSSCSPTIPARALFHCAILLLGAQSDTRHQHSRWINMVQRSMGMYIPTYLLLR